jgi:uncharacterized membrane protein/DNA-binding transcriptional ArsR family regulator
MSLTTVQTISLLAATIATGLTAGVFGLYAHTIMRGLGKTDDRTFIGAFQAIDRAIINPLFMLTFFGALVFSAAAAAAHLRDDAQPILPWILAATVLYLATVVITMAVNVPLNDAIKTAGDPDKITNLAAVRANFHETRWIAWNLVRTVATTIAFVCLAWALVLHGRSTTGGPEAIDHGQAQRVTAAASSPAERPMLDPSCCGVSMIQVVHVGSCFMADVKSQPPVEQFDIGAIFGALADPLRRNIVEQLLADAERRPRQCSTFEFGVSKSTMTHHFRVLRESGLISAVDYGNRCEVTLRRDEIDSRFPGLLGLLGAGGLKLAAAKDGAQS